MTEEILIENGISYKEKGKDGILGESVDVILCALDIIFIAHPDITNEEILDVVSKKLKKWKEKNFGN